MIQSAYLAPIDSAPVQQQLLLRSNRAISVHSARCWRCADNIVRDVCDYFQFVPGYWCVVGGGTSYYNYYI